MKWIKIAIAIVITTIFATYSQDLEQASIFSIHGFAIVVILVIKFKHESDNDDPDNFAY